MAAPDLETALTGARLVEEAGALLTLGEEPERMVAHAFERLGQLVPYDLATVLLREGEALRVAFAVGPLATPQLSEARIPVRGNLRLINALKARSKPATFEEDDPGEDTFHGLLEMPHGHSCLVAPLRSRGETFGLMTLDAMVCRQYPESVLHHVGVFASLLALGIKQAEHLARLAERERSLAEEVSYFREVQRRDVLQEPMRAGSPAMRAVLDQLGQVAATTTTVLITGETGTGKEKAAQTLHHLSPRREKPFIKVNCSALPATLIESELFGHVKGAFSGAASARKGRFELADGGTLFLDEIGDLPLDLQPKLLRAIQEKEIDPLGAEKPRKVDVRLVAATHADLRKAVAEGRFREDLYYRLSVFPIHIPPLRERTGDIPALAEAFLERFARDNRRPPIHLPAAVREQLEVYPWPGNVRELHNVLERAAILSAGRELRLPPGALPARNGGERTGRPLTWEAQERAYLERLLHHVRGKIAGADGAAALAGLAPSTLLSRLEKLGLRPRDFREA
ncbi:sigma 54-interacting transcriptional regulator [Geothrix fermentans]|uniref:sigma 54-interacting transcriptional regulator n=1 Tax=Geothrix fermentans TaxID=44676 RepID=UPI00040403DC|nr:sigma 54-interacting transcriptional regulator [Geothrix fermentans]